MKVLYFAWVREKIGFGAETVEPPAESAATVGDLLDWLAARSPAHTAALGDKSALRVALDQRYVTLDAPAAGASEIAVFPPMTGG
ncbi:MAG: molybdopterin converting factor subunit 1 [Rhodospirillales bacterium]